MYFIVVNAPHEGLRKTGKIFLVFIYRPNCLPTGYCGLSKRIRNQLFHCAKRLFAESQWPVHQINWQRSRYIYDLYYVYNKISREIYDYCVSNKIVDPALIAKWKKPGYERLCSTYAINPRNYKFGTVSICRVPKSSLTAVRTTQTMLPLFIIVTHMQLQSKEKQFVDRL